MDEWPERSDSLIIARFIAYFLWSSAWFIRRLFRSLAVISRQFGRSSDPLQHLIDLHSG